MIGVGGRIRIRPTVYVVGEIAPRVTGYDPGNRRPASRIEKRAGGHIFQLNFSNGFGTTMAQIARGGTEAATTGIWASTSRASFLALRAEDAHGSRRARGGGSAGFLVC